MSRSVFSAPQFHNEAAAYEFVEARLWPDGPVCPKCGETKRIGVLTGKSTRIGVRKCYACRKPFTVKVGTIFEDSHIKMHVWLQAMHLMASSKKGISTNQLSRILGVTLQSAWFLSHRIREAMKQGGSLPPLGNTGLTIEADETYVGRRAETKAFRPPAEKQIVLALVERDGAARSFHIPNVRMETLGTVIGKHAAQGGNLMSDEWYGYKAMAPWFASHNTVKHSAKEYVRGDVHTNTVEGYFSILKRGIYGVYQHVSEAHLHRYLSEFDFRYSNREKLGVDDATRTNRMLDGVKGKRLTYTTSRSGRPGVASHA